MLLDCNRIELSMLRIIQMEYQSVIGDRSNVNMFGYYKNQFEMSHLPRLTRFFGDESCFHFGQVRIEGAIVCIC